MKKFSTPLEFRMGEKPSNSQSVVYTEKEQELASEQESVSEREQVSEQDQASKQVNTSKRDQVRASESKR